jgi:hypothetical protein
MLDEYVLLFVFPDASVNKRAASISMRLRVAPYHAVYAHGAYLRRQIMVDWIAWQSLQQDEQSADYQEKLSAAECV